MKGRDGSLPFAFRRRDGGGEGKQRLRGDLRRIRAEALRKEPRLRRAAELWGRKSAAEGIESVPDFILIRMRVEAASAVCGVSPTQLYASQ